VKYKNQRSHHRSNLKATEDIVYLSESEVTRRYEALKRLIEGKGFSNRKRHQLEIEACYLWRELEQRKARRAAHALYIKNTRRGGRRRG